MGIDEESSGGFARKQRLHLFHYEEPTGTLDLCQKRMTELWGIFSSRYSISFMPHALCVIPAIGLLKPSICLEESPLASAMAHQLAGAFTDNRVDVNPDGDCPVSLLDVAFGICSTVALLDIKEACFGRIVMGWEYNFGENTQLGYMINPTTAEEPKGSIKTSYGSSNRGTAGSDGAWESRWALFPWQGSGCIGALRNPALAMDSWFR